MSKHPPSINELRDIVNNDETTADDLLTAVRYWYMDQSKNLVRERAEPETLSTLLERTLHHNPLDHQVIATGWGNYDGVFGGLYRGELVVLGGRPGMGKSSLLINLGLNVSSRIPVLFFSFDLSKQTVSDRFVRQKAESDVPKDASKDAFELRNKIRDQLLSHKLYVSQMDDRSMIMMEEIIRKYKEEKEVGVILIDYLQLLTDGRSRWSNREQELAQWMRFLKRLSIELDVAVVVSSQLSRAVESRGGDKKPVLSDLRESGAIEQDADKVMFIYRPEYYGLDEDMDGLSTRGVIELIMAKNINGETGSVTMRQTAGFAAIKADNTIVSDFVSFSSRDIITGEKWDSFEDQSPF